MKNTSIVLLFLIFSGCSQPFSYSPFEVNLDDALRHTTAKNLSALALKDTLHIKQFKIALLSDNHYHYKKLSDALSHINARHDISFVIVVGDITENGLQKEFELYHSIMKKCRTPYFTVIGNHDYLSNGSEVFKEIFGDFNYSFIFKHVKFVIWDNVVWESDKFPDFQWLEGQLSHIEPTDGISSGKVELIIPLAHIPPSDGQFAETRDQYHQLLLKNNISLSIHGHRHKYSLTNYFNDSIQFLTVGTPQSREYSVITFDGRAVDVERIEY